MMPAGIAGVGQCFSALDDRVVGDPPAPPDERRVLVVPAPHEASSGHHLVDPVTAHEGAEDRSAVPPGRTHPSELAARTHDHATLAVGEQRVFP